MDQQEQPVITSETLVPVITITKLVCKKPGGTFVAEVEIRIETRFTFSPGGEQAIEPEFQVSRETIEVTRDNPLFATVDAATVTALPYELLLLNRRTDGSFVAEIKGSPFHIAETDNAYPTEEVANRWAVAQDIAAEMGDTLTLEPISEPPPAPLVPPPPSIEQISEAFKAAGKTDEQIAAFLALAAAI